MDFKEPFKDQIRMSMGDDGMISSGLMAHLLQDCLVQLWSRNRNPGHFYRCTRKCSGNSWFPVSTPLIKHSYQQQSPVFQGQKAPAGRSSGSGRARNRPVAGLVRESIQESRGQQLCPEFGKSGLRSVYHSHSHMYR